MDLNVTPEDIKLSAPPVFKEKDIVEFICLDVEENQAYKKLVLKCKVLSGEHAGRRYQHHINLTGDQEIQKVKRARFALAFWKPEEINADGVNPARLVSRKFTATAQRVREWQGKTYQDFDYWKDLGLDETQVQQPAGNPEINTPISPDDVPF